MNGVPRKKIRSTGSTFPLREPLYPPSKSKFEVYGEEMIEKEVKQSGNSGRVYLPPEWVGKHVKIIRID
jgi:putative transposon-encoded protein